MQFMKLLVTSNYDDNNYPTVENCLFGSVKLTKNTNINKYGYSGYGIGFDRRASFQIGNDIGRNEIIFGVDLSSSLRIGNKKKDNLILGKGITLGLEHAISAEKNVFN